MARKDPADKAKDGRERGRAAPLSRKPADASDGADASVSGPREVIEQAGRDIARGLVDTDKRGIPSDVPGPRRSPDGAGTDVAAGGGDRSSHSERRRGVED